MILSIRLCLRHSGRISNRKKIIFKSGLNVVVGPNGSGKSSLLEALFNCPDCVCTYDADTNIQYFNSEIMNPHRNDAAFRGPQGSLIKVRAMFSSHGETMRDVLRFTPLKPGDCFLLDEPDSGHDIQWVFKIRQGLEILAKHGCQIIVASHHPVFWDAENMIELKRGYMDQAWAKFRESLY